MKAIFFTLLFSVQTLFAFTSISSKYNGLQLSNEAGLARLTKWSDSNSLTFEAYGQIKQNNLCLSANRGGIVTWKPCVANYKAQIWALKEEQLRNEYGFCAETEAYTNSILNPRIVTKTCKDIPLQKWTGH